MFFFTETAKEGGGDGAKHGWREIRGSVALTQIWSPIPIEKSEQRKARKGTGVGSHRMPALNRSLQSYTFSLLYMSGVCVNGSPCTPVSPLQWHLCTRCSLQKCGGVDVCLRIIQY